MADKKLLRSGDKVFIKPKFGKAMVTMPPATIFGTVVKVMVKGAPACSEADAKQFMMPGCLYNTPQFPIPGTGMVTIKALAGDQLTKKVTGAGMALIMKGSNFTAEFTVMVPAQIVKPTGPEPDPTPKYEGKGFFLPANTVHTGS